MKPRFTRFERFLRIGVHALQRRTWILLSVVLFGSAACRSGEAPSHALTVFAASSLREPLTEIARRFEAAHAPLRVRLHFAGTQELRVQVEHGARADVFASADLMHMASLERTGRVRTPRVFARNAPVLIVSPQASSFLHDLRDLPNATRVVLGAREVPIGRYAAQVLQQASAAWGSDFAARVEAHVISRELNVRQVLAKVRLAEAQAGIVYRSDVHGVSDVQVVALPPEIQVVAEYPIAPLVDAREPKLAQDFVDFVCGEAGQAILAEAGFLPVPRER